MIKIKIDRQQHFSYIIHLFYFEIKYISIFINTHFSIYNVYTDILFHVLKKVPNPNKKLQSCMVYYIRLMIHRLKHYLIFQIGLKIKIK